MLMNVAGGPIGAPSVANRETVRDSKSGKASTLSGVRCTNFPKPPRRIARPSGATPIATPARGDQFKRSTMASRSKRSPSSNVTREFRRQRSCTNAANSIPLTVLLRAPAEHGQLRKRTVQAPDLDRPARAETVELRPLQIGAELEHVRAVPVAGQAERLDPLQAGDLAFLVVEEAAALSLRRVDHWRAAVRVDVDLEPSARQRGLEDERRAREPADRRCRWTSRSG